MPTSVDKFRPGGVQYVYSAQPSRQRNKKQNFGRSVVGKRGDGGRVTELLARGLAGATAEEWRSYGDACCQRRQFARAVEAYRESKVRAQVQLGFDGDGFVMHR
jgi:hypothetical protein